MKKKTITLVIYMLVCISLVSVGFAAWIITGGTSTETTAGIEASQVTDKSLNIVESKWTQYDKLTQKDVVTDDPTILFGVPAGTRLRDTDWLRFDNDVLDEKLEATYSFTLNVGEGGANDAKLKDVFNIDGSSINFEIDDAHEDFLNSAVENKYLVGPTLTYFVGGGNKITDKDDFFEAIKAVNASSVEIKIQIEFAWGDKSGNDNPYTTFNAITTPSAADKTRAKDCLNAAYALNGATYTLSIVLDAVKA